MRPDLTKFRQSLAILRRLFSLWQIFEPTNAIGPISIVIKAKYWAHNLAIWSHCRQPALETLA